MHGRGYVNKGDSLAASFIAKEYEELNLQSFDKGFFQHFEVAVNTYPGNMQITIDDIPISPGKDFLIKGFSKGKKGTYDLVWLTKEVVKSSKRKKRFLAIDLSEKFLIVDSTGMGRDGASSFLTDNKVYTPNFIYLVKDLGAWAPIPEVYDVTGLDILKEVVPENAKRISIDIENKYFESYITQNVVGYIEGVIPDTFFVLSAHYDHLGQIGRDVHFPGGNDNASGVSTVLSLAKHFSNHDTKPKYSIVFVAFAAEELGILGSKYFVENSPIPLQQIKFVINLDLTGTGDEGMMVVNGRVYQSEFNKLVEINTAKDYLPVIKKRGKARNSDHYYFTEEDVPAFFFYTLGGPGYYHDIYDKSETLPLTEFSDILDLIIEFIGLM